MRLIDADELLEHAYRDKLDSRELIANMIESAPTVNEIPINIPLPLIIKALEQQQKTGHWIGHRWVNGKKEECIVPIKNGVVSESCICSECKEWLVGSDEYGCGGNYCPSCGAKMESEAKE